MPRDEDINWLKMTLRATFPYLVFVAVFVLGTLVVILWASSETLSDGAVVPLERAHAHNDYLHTQPLTDALDRGFCSVEADIYLIDGALLVAHDRDKVAKEKTLEALYLEPLWKRFKAQGSIFQTAAPVTLLIDIKSEGESTFAALNTALTPYAPMLTHFTPAETNAGAVTVIISGNRAVDAILATSPRLAGVDGRLSDLEGSRTAQEFPLISDNWTNHFSWRGEGPLPDAEKEKLLDIVSRTHAKGMRLRFWATPQRDVVWKALYDAGVDLLNADDLDGLRNLILGASTAE